MRILKEQNKNNIQDEAYYDCIIPHLNFCELALAANDDLKSITKYICKTVMP